jgi:hypothetical protein
VIVIPSLAEMLRVKAFLLAQRRAARDFVDVAALAQTLGSEQCIKALGYLNLVYPAGTAQTTISAFAEACEGEPVDIGTVDLAAYQGVKAPFTDRAYVLESCRRLGRSIVKLELADRLPRDLDGGFYGGGAA